MNFIEWRKGYINGNKAIGNKPKGIIYQFCRYYVLNNTVKWWRIDLYLASRALETNIELYNEVQELRKRYK